MSWNNKEEIETTMQHGTTMKIIDYVLILMFRLFSFVLLKTLLPKDSQNKTEISLQISVFLSGIRFEIPKFVFCSVPTKSAGVGTASHCFTNTLYDGRSPELKRGKKCRKNWR